MLLTVRLIASSLTLCAVVGCGAARRPYQEPVAEAPRTWTRVSGSVRPVDTDALERWWTTFGDPVLNDLVQRVVAGNVDMRVAISRVREARAQIVIARAGRMPSVTTDFTATASHVSAEARGGIESPDDIQESYGLGIDASWEVDVFGEKRSGIDAAAATAQGSALDLQDVLISAVAEAGAQYVRVRSLQERIQLGNRNVQLQSDTLEIAQFRFQAGLTTELDIHQARTTVEGTRAQIAALQLELEQTVHALGLLQGGGPGSLNALLNTPGPIPVPPADVAVGVPAEALRRRPDVRAAERRVAAQASQVDAARARLYPRFSLLGSIGLETLDVARLFVPGASFFRVTPTASWNVFDRRQLKQNVLVQGERETQAALQYEATVLRALQDVENALSAYAQEQVRREHLAAAVNASQLAADLSMQRYNTGLRDFRDVVDAQRTLVSLQDQLATSQSNVSTAVMRLYRALGGGWATASQP